MANVIIIGTGGHAKVVADIVKLSGDSITGFFNDIESTGTFLGYPVLGKTDVYEKYLDNKFIIAIGSTNARIAISEKLKNAEWYTAIHPTAVVSSIGTAIGEGSVVCANAVVNPCASIGKHCIINTNSSVEHDNTICDYVHISVGTKLAGNVTVGKGTWVGIGATVSNNISICDNCMIAAGAVVVNNISKSGTYMGVPARLYNKD
ncbi:MAG: acetyltransferase [Acutalibacteraceae bacterium]|nr:acetyltransferase [Acutalibacteraceae bacterium]